MSEQEIPEIPVKGRWQCNGCLLLVDGSVNHLNACYITVGVFQFNADGFCLHYMSEYMIAIYTDI